MGPLKDSDGNIITDPTKMSNMLNDYFGTVFNGEDEASNSPEVSTMFRGESNHMLNMTVLNKEVVYNKLIKLNVSKAPGDDTVPWILMENANGIVLSFANYL